MRVSNIDMGTFNDREGFALEMVAKLNDTMSALLGPQQTDAAIAMVARLLARQFNTALAGPASSGAMTPQDVAEALVELKRRIGGEFRIVSVSPEQIVFHNTRCPFGGRAKGRGSLCQMTAGVFEDVATAQLGDTRVSIPAALARGDDHCRVVMDLKTGCAAAL